jgi:flagellar basal-body rod modification protein FlgD
MSTTSSASSASSDATALLASLQAKSAGGYTADAYDDLDTGAFMKMLISELSNQDPTSPMDSTQIVQQVSQIRAIQSNTQLTETLKDVSLGQAVATASSLLGKQISGLNDQSAKVTGKVDSVTVADGTVKIHVGSNTLSIDNISEILPESSTSSTATT